MFKILQLKDCPSIPMEGGRGEQVKLINASLGTEKSICISIGSFLAAEPASCITTTRPTTSTSSSAVRARS